MLPYFCTGFLKNMIDLYSKSKLSILLALSPRFVRIWGFRNFHEIFAKKRTLTWSLEEALSNHLGKISLVVGQAEGLGLQHSKKYYNIILQRNFFALPSSILCNLFISCTVHYSQTRANAQWTAIHLFVVFVFGYIVGVLCWSFFVYVKNVAYLLLSYGNKL